MTFRHVAITTALLFMVLAVAWMFFPQQMLAQWGIEFSDGAGVMCRRGAAFYAGIAFILFMARRVEQHSTQVVLIQGMVTICTILIILAIYECITGHASYQILAAAVIELIIGLAFLYARNTPGKAKKISR
ncbi:hypothetical protein QCD60_23675 [Pokkaliibacter sp. MBI-7]|uniref:hypothetical protein n=1 Tax=Pokkaliibacter sp. MBI-7 TaxID=3040600 RepID=UPI00244A0FA6|nr:hypothetical protein [Pokkaliibacter sp. MBI-7]MDH2435527.1 hypothetical protein [Pokkaliibacter sp. MBI-7]